MRVPSQIRWMIVLWVAIVVACLKPIRAWPDESHQNEAMNSLRADSTADTQVDGHRYNAASFKSSLLEKDSSRLVHGCAQGASGACPAKRANESRVAYFVVLNSRYRTPFHDRKC